MKPYVEAGCAHYKCATPGCRCACHDRLVSEKYMHYNMRFATLLGFAVGIVTGILIGHFWI